MKFIGYFPGEDIGAAEQYGRQIHVFHQVQKLSARSDIDSSFVVGGGEESFESADVYSVSSGGGFPARLLAELRRLALLVRLVISADDPVLYTREGPNFAPLVVSFILGIPLIVENNGEPTLPEEGEYPLQPTMMKWIRYAKWRQAAQIVTVSDALASQLKKNGLSDIKVIENGVDTELFDCQKEVLANPPYKLRYIGGLQHYQNLDSMIEVVSQLDHEFQFTIVGGSQDEHDRLRTTVENCGVEDRVEFVERVPHTDVPNHISEADICLGGYLPEAKGAPIKLYESLSCGREIVFVNDEGLEQMGTHPGVHIIPSGPSDEVAAALDDVLEQCETNYEGRQFVVEERSWEAVVDKMVVLGRETVSA